MTEATLRIKVDASDADKASRSLDSLTKSGDKADQTTSKLTDTTKRLAAAATALATSMAVREIVAYADAWQSAENQLRLVTNSTEQLTGVQSALLGVANNTRSSFESTANLYSRLSRATSEMGLSQQELIGITTTINQSFAVSGATAAEAAAAITQLSQGLAAGALRGDEFNSVSEQAPGIMRAIAESLNMTVGELRAFAAEGGITADIVVKALQRSADSIDKDFGKATATFGQSMQVAKNNMLAFVGGAEGVQSAVGAAGDAVVFMSDNLEILGSVAKAAGIGMGVMGTVQLVQFVKGMQAATAAQAAFNLVAKANPYVLLATGVAALSLALIEYKRRQDEATFSAREFVQSGGSVAELAKRIMRETQPATVAIEENAEALNSAADAMEWYTYRSTEFVGPIQQATYVTEGFVGPLQQVAEAAEEAGEKVTGFASDSGNASREYAEDWRRTHESLSQNIEGLIGEIESGGDAFEFLGDIAVNTAKRIAAEWLALKAMNLFGIQMPTGGGGSVASGAGNSLINAAVSSGFKALIGGGSAATTAAMGAGGAIGGVGATVAGGTVAGGVGAAAGGAAAGGGMLAGAGAALSGAGSSIMAGLAAIPGWGWALGGAALAAKLLDDSGTMSGNAGMLIRPTAGADGRTFDVPAFDSGFDPVGFARREDQAAANQVIDVFRADDAVLTALAKASGIDVRYNANNFGGYDEKGRGNGLFFGTANEDGKNTGVSIEEQRTQFVSQWLRGLGGQVDQSVINDALSAGSADAMIARAAKLAGIDGSHANGLDYVPFDGYRAELHKGERVQTASQAQSTDAAFNKLAAEFGTMRAMMAETAAATRRTADILLRVTRDGQSLQTTAA